MRILFLPEWYPTENNTVNGIFNKELAALLAKEVDLHCVYFTVGEVSEENTTNSRANGFLETVYTIPSAYPKWKRLFFQYKSLIQVVKKAETSGSPYALTHVSVAWKAGFFAWCLKWFYRIPYLVTEHYTAYMPQDNSMSVMRKWASYWVLRNASKVVAVSDGLKEVLEKNRVKEVQTIPNRVHAEFQSIAVSKHRTVSDNCTLLHITNFDLKQKQSDVILSVFLEMAESNPTMHLIVVAPEAPLNAFLSSAPQNLKEKIKIIGPGLSRKEMAKVYASSDVLVSFSKYETFGLTIAEAACCGVPSIYTACGGPEYYMDSDMGIQVNANSRDSLKKAMASLLITYPFDKVKIAQKARNKFQDVSILNEYLLIYESVTRK